MNTIRMFYAQKQSANNMDLAFLPNVVVDRVSDSPKKSGLLKSIGEKKMMELVYQNGEWYCDVFADTFCSVVKYDEYSVQLYNIFVLSWLSLVSFFRLSKQKYLKIWFLFCLTGQLVELDNISTGANSSAGNSRASFALSGITNLRGSIGGGPGSPVNRKATRKTKGRISYNFTNGE